jgi:hypothetical protein
MQPDQQDSFETTPEGVPIPEFTPWRAKRERARGWAPSIQRAFIAELTRIGSVNSAARAVGRTPRSAYQLRDKLGAESFAAAWEEAVYRGQQAARDTAIQRALHGEIMPHFKNGQFAGYKVRHNDQLLIAAMMSHRRGPANEVDRHALHEMRYRLEKWESALRREALDKADLQSLGGVSPAEAWDAHVIWEREMKRAARDARARKIRAAVRKTLNPPPRPEPSVRML